VSEEAVRTTIDGALGELSVQRWPAAEPRQVVVLVHGYGEHVGRYEHVARALARRGSAVVGHDHAGHGRSAGEPALVEDFEPVVDDLHRVVTLAREEHPGMPVVLVGHSMGGLIAARYAQRHGDELAGLVLSGPAVGLGPVIEGWLAAPELPSDPIDVAVLSRDPAVGEAYAADPLVWHGGWKRPTLEAFVAADRAIAEGPGLGDLPLLYVHGKDDELVPVDLARPVVQRLAGPEVAVHVLPGCRHEVFNELERDATLALVADFIGRVCAR
jgi:alpha-beta hydrolase superfamily lysophospholipase